MQWQKGLQSFVNLKHGLAMNKESFTCFFKTNKGFFDQYKHNLVGLTGTVGSVHCQGFLEESYNVDILKIPTFKTKRHHRMSTWICRDTDHWIKQISLDINIARHRNKACLVIVNNIQKAEHLFKRLQSDKIQVYQYWKSDSKQQLSLTKSKLRPGDVVVATNLAGRGTDLKLSEEVLIAGGLHVVLGFYAVNSRVEQQALGRSSRKGEKGTSRIVVNVTDANTQTIVDKARRCKEEDHAERWQPGFKGVTKGDIINEMNGEQSMEYEHLIHQVRLKKEESSLKRDAATVKREYQMLEWSLKKFDRFCSENEIRREFLKDKRSIFKYLKSEFGLEINRLAELLHDPEFKKKPEEELKEMVKSEWKVFKKRAKEIIEDPSMIDDSKILANIAFEFYREGKRVGLAKEMVNKAISINEFELDAINLKVGMLYNEEGGKESHETQIEVRDLLTKKLQYLETVQKIKADTLEQLDTQREYIVNAANIAQEYHDEVHGGSLRTFDFREVATEAVSGDFNIQNFVGDQMAFKKRNLSVGKNVSDQKNLDKQSETAGPSNPNRDPLIQNLINKGLYADPDSGKDKLYSSEVSMADRLKFEREIRGKNFNMNSVQKGGLKKEKTMDSLFTKTQIEETSKVMDQLSKGEEIEVVNTKITAPRDEIRDREDLKIQKKDKKGFLGFIFGLISGAVGVYLLCATPLKSFGLSLINQGRKMIMENIEMNRTGTYNEDKIVKGAVMGVIGSGISAYAIHADCYFTNPFLRKGIEIFGEHLQRKTGRQEMFDPILDSKEMILKAGSCFQKHGFKKMINKHGPKMLECALGMDLGARPEWSKMQENSGNQPSAAIRNLIDENLFSKNKSQNDLGNIIQNSWKLLFNEDPAKVSEKLVRANSDNLVEIITSSMKEGKFFNLIASNLGGKKKPNPMSNSAENDFLKTKPKKYEAAQKYNQNIETIVTSYEKNNYSGQDIDTLHRNILLDKIKDFGFEKIEKLFSGFMDGLNQHFCAVPLPGVDYFKKLVKKSINMYNQKETGSKEGIDVNRRRDLGKLVSDIVCEHFPYILKNIGSIGLNNAMIPKVISGFMDKIDDLIPVKLEKGALMLKEMGVVREVVQNFANGVLSNPLWRQSLSQFGTRVDQVSKCFEKNAELMFGAHAKKTLMTRDPCQ